MALAALTLAHVLVSLAGILYGIVVAYGMIAGRIEKRWNDGFLITTVATSVSGFFFPVREFFPSHALGIISLFALAFACAAFWRYRLLGGWLTTYAVGAIVALYLNVFVLVVQLFRHVPPLTRLAPTQTEPAFQLTQLVTLAAFITIGILAVRGVRKMSRPALASAAAA